MATAQATFRDRYGLHPRAAHRIQATAASFAASVTLAADGGSAIAASSMLGLISSGIRTGDRIEIAADGPDDGAAAEAMRALLDGGVCHP